MKKITLKELRLLNFKGIRDASFKFGSVTNVYGMNGTGKTTICDAFLWLLFGKDSTDRKDFEIKTLDENNNPFHKMSHEVQATLNVDDDEVVIRRTYKENWPTKKGTATETFSGHTTNFYWNEVPMALGEYQKQIAGILDENIFKLVTNTGYFSSLKWQERRAVLETIAGTITNEMVFDAIASTKNDFSELINALNTKKTLVQYRAEISAKKKKIKDEKDLLPSRIDEAKRSLPELVDYDRIETMMHADQQELFKVEDMINNKALAARDAQEQINIKVRQVQDLSKQASDIEYTVKNQVQQGRRDREQVITNYRSDLSTISNNISNIERDINNHKNNADQLQGQANQLRAKWNDVNKEELVFKTGEFACPSCKREFDPTDVDAKKNQMTANFNQDKSTRLNEITEKGKKIAADISEIQTKVNGQSSRKLELEQEYKSLDEKLLAAVNENSKLSANDEQSYKDALATNKEYIKLAAEIAQLNNEISTPISVDDNTELLTRKREISARIDNYRTQLSGKAQRERIESRIVELSNQESEQANELARLEKIEFSIDQFEKAKMTMLEDRVNSMFKIVRFKMFEDQINGGEVPCCTTLINGVPYSDANTAGKIQAGIDIINTLCRFHNISAPIFIDNRESVVNIPETDSQIVNLIVSEPDKKLRVEARNAA